MKRLDYETLSMEELIMETTEGFLEASVVVNEPKSTVKATGHESGGTFDFSGYNDWEGLNDGGTN